MAGQMWTDGLPALIPGGVWRPLYLLIFRIPTSRSVAIKTLDARFLVSMVWARWFKGPATIES